MQIINGNRIYDEHDINAMLLRLTYITDSFREQIRYIVQNSGYDMDTPALLNVISDLVEYNIDYLYSLDSAVTDKFIMLMEEFGLV